MPAVVVVGGGVSGLTCAWRLQRAGFDVEVLEREETPGGRMRSELRDGFVLERGARFVASADRNLHAVVRALDLEAQLRPLVHSTRAILHEGRLHPLAPEAPLRLLASSLLSFRAKLRLVRLAAELAGRWQRLDPLRPELAAALDGENLAAGLRRRVGDENFERFFAPLAAYAMDSEAHELSFASGLLALRSVAAGIRLESFEGGMGLLTRSLASRVSVRSGCEVLAVETETDGARVRYRARGRESRVIADAVVVAVPGDRVGGLCPKLTPEERGFFEHVRYARGITAQLLLEAEPAGLPFAHVVFPRSEGLDLSGLCFGHRRVGAAPPGTGLLEVSFGGAAALQWWKASDETIAECAVDTLARTPIGRVAPFDFAVQRSPNMLPRFGPGALRRLARFLRRMDRSPRLAFAGDYLVGPSAEGGVTSGMRAATEIERSL